MTNHAIRIEDAFLDGVVGVVRGTAVAAGVRLASIGATIGVVEVPVVTLFARSLIHNTVAANLLQAAGRRRGQGRGEASSAATPDGRGLVREEHAEPLVLDPELHPDLFGTLSSGPGPVLSAPGDFQAAIGDHDTADAAPAPARVRVAPLSRVRVLDPGGFVQANETRSARRAVVADHEKPSIGLARIMHLPHENRFLATDHQRKTFGRNVDGVSA